MVGATAILNAIYYPVDIGTRTVNQQVAIAVFLGTRYPSVLIQKLQDPEAGAGGLGPQEKGTMRCPFS